MAITDFPNGVSSFGIPVLPGGLAVPPGGNVYFLDPAHGSDGNDGTAPDRAFATLPTAYAALTANQNDVLFYIAGSSSISLSATLTWSKSYTHFIGLCAPTQVAQRARIFQTATATGLSPLIKVSSATGCIFANLYIFQGVDDATSLINVEIEGGGRHYFQNVHFAGGGHATQAIDGGASLLLDSTEENTFVNCTFGVDTIAAATGMMALLFDGESHRNIFKDCHFTMYSGNSGSGFVEVLDGTGFDRYNIFKSCLFTNTAAANAMTTAFVIPAGVGLPRVFYIWDSFLHGAGDWDANDRGVVFVNNGTITGGGNAGLFVVSAAT